MARICPTYIEISGVIGAPLKFKWGNTIAMKIFGHEVNDRTFEAVDKVAYRASYSLGVAASEWVAFRLKDHVDVSDLLSRTEAAWATSIGSLYSKELKFTLNKDADKSTNLADGPLQLCTRILYSVHHRYTNGNVDLAESVVRQLMLAQHVIPKSCGFEEWLSDSLRKLTSAFPRVAKYDTESEVYDYSQEKPVPREFFEKDFTYSDAAATEALRAFLKTLDPAKNPYLRSADEMKASGFKGTPYSL